jgi:hypothetical protein
VADWGTYWKSESTDWRFTESNEYIEGNFGRYGLNSGYIKDFYPYDQTKKQFVDSLLQMQRESYLVNGQTKIVDIDFAMMFPQTGIFVTTNMLFEFTDKGQIIPTRIDIMPLKLASFATYNTTPTAQIDLMKFLLVLYTIYSVLVNFQSYSMSKILSFASIAENFTDLMIIFLQTYCFFLKL